MDGGRKYFTTAIVLLFALAGFYLGYNLRELKNDKTEIAVDKNNEHNLRFKGHYKFINPLLDFVLSDDLNEIKTADSKTEIFNFIHEQEKNFDIAQISFYFRDLNSGLEFGINEEYRFKPASLLKVPIMMVFFHESESDSNILSRELVYKKDRREDQFDQAIKPEETLIDGKSYRIDELIEKMVIYSDNRAMFLLYNYLGDEKFNSFINELNIELNDKEEVSVRDYSGFFRILYNSSYLNHTNSEKALEILSKTKFDDGLAAGIPSFIELANKFGERNIDGIQQLHDCGIVYFPRNPYLICVMTQGKNLEDQKQAISKISAFVFSEVETYFRRSKQFTKFLTKI